MEISEFLDLLNEPLLYNRVTKIESILEQTKLWVEHHPDPTLHYWFSFAEAHLLNLKGQPQEAITILTDL